MSFKRLLLIVLSWRLLILLVAIPAIFLLPIRPGYTQVKEGLSLMNLILMWVNFDGIHFFDLAHYGYNTGQTGYLQAFFPVFPMAIRLMTQFITSEILNGYLIVHASLVAALWFLYKLVRLDLPKNTSTNVILLLLLFPTAFFFGSYYTESPFLLLTVASFYFGRRQNWFMACLLAGIASATRVTGIFLFPALLLEFYISHKSNLRSSVLDKRLFFFALAPLGLLLYMNFLNTTVHDPFYFATIQPRFGAGREVSRLILLHQVFYRYARMLVTVNRNDPLFFTVVLEFISGALFTVLTVFTFFKTRTSYALYTALSFLLPTLTGTFSSIPRYALVLFPCFMLLSTWYTRQNKYVRGIYLLTSIILSLFTISFFTRGYFIG